MKMVKEYCHSCLRYAITNPMIQVFGLHKSFDTKAALRFFSERRIPVQFVDLKEKEMSRGEFESVLSSLKKATGSLSLAIEAMTDTKSKDYASIAYLYDSEKGDKLFENQAKLLKLPICRNGKDAATAGLAQKVWESWK